MLLHILAGRTVCYKVGAAYSALVCVAEEAAADARQRAKEAREWIDNWKSKQ